MSVRCLRFFATLTVGLLALAASSCSKPAPQSFEAQNGLLNPEAFESAKEAFAEVETPADGLGAHFNDSSCANCHPAPGKALPGGSSTITELRAGHVGTSNAFSPAPGGTLITLRAREGLTSEVDALPASENVRERFITPSLFGAGFVESVADETLRRIAQDQSARTKGRIRGLVRDVDVLEAPGKKAVGRFGWAAQHASLLSFSADAYRNEMGITSRLMPDDNTFLGETVDDGVADPEDAGGEFGEDVEKFAAFMRALSAPPRVPPSDRAAGADIEAGAKAFESIGCSTCHLPQLVTAKAGTLVNAGAFRVQDALGSKTFHPFGDFLLHDIGTGSNILREGMPAEARSKVRTAALWGLGTRLSRKQPLLHDGSASTLPEAIQRHTNTAAEEATRFQRLPDGEKAKVLRFLQSL